jgi:hypothetical protein
MSSFFTDAQIERLSGQEVRCDFMVDFEFASGPLYAWNGESNLEVNGKTYKPMHGFGVIEGLGLPGPGTTSESVTLSLDGLPGMSLDFLAKALEDTREVDQQLVTISLQLFDEDWQTVGSPIAVFRGFMQPPKVTRSVMMGTEGGTQGVSIVAENIFFGRSRPPYGRNTDRDQQARYPGDKFFGFVSSLVFKKIGYPDY